MCEANADRMTTGQFHECTSELAPITLRTAMWFNPFTEEHAFQTECKSYSDITRLWKCQPTRRDVPQRQTSARVQEEENDWAGHGGSPSEPDLQDPASTHHPFFHMIWFYDRRYLKHSHNQHQTSGFVKENKYIKINNLRRSLRLTGVQRLRQQDPEPVPPHGAPGAEGHRWKPTSAAHTRRHLYHRQVQKGETDDFCLGNSQSAHGSAHMQSLQSSQRKLKREG